MPLLLTEADIRQALSMDDLIDAMASALARFSAGEVQQPLRTVLRVGPEQAYFGVMPAYVPSPPALGTKLVTTYNSNAARGLPSHLAVIVLLDPETGALTGILDGRYITEARTAAVSAVATRHLARPDASVLAILGSGVQARSHLAALARVRRLRNAQVWSPTAAHRDAFVREMQSHVEVAVCAAASAQDAVAGADLIVLATSAAEPVIDNHWVRDGAHVVSVGACRPDQREMDPALTARGRVFVDSRAGALAEAGDIVQGIASGLFRPDHIAGELGEVVLGRVAGRTAPGEVTIFKSLGMAVEDVVAGDLALRRAQARGLGRDIDIR